MYSVTTPNRHGFSRSQVTFDLPPQYDRPQTATNASRRDASADSSTPYVNGKKNNSFFNPSLVSNSVFYDHNYGYVNDMPNDRLLSPVRHDKFSKKSVDQYERRPLTPPKANKPDFNEERATRAEYYMPRKLETDEVEKKSAPQRNVNRSSREIEPVANDRRNSNLSQNPPARKKSDLEYTRKPSEEVVIRSQEIKTPAGKPTNAYPEPKNDDIRDDRSEASSAVWSTLSSTNYVCPKCLNKHMAGCKAYNCMREKEQDREGERKLAAYNERLNQAEDAKRRDEKSRKADETRNAQWRLNEQYLQRLEDRRSPKKEGVTALNAVFQKQEEMRQSQKALGEMFRRTLKEQIISKEEERADERRRERSPYSTSLQINGGYNNKYLESPYSVRATLQNQVEEKYYQQQMDRETDKRSAQYIQEQAMRSQAEEERSRRERSANQKRELKDALERSINDKEDKKQQEMMKKALERFNVDRQQAEYQRNQYDQDIANRKQLFDFKQGLLNQLQNSSYRKRYEERKAMKEGTSFDPKRRVKKVYPCGDCNMPYEKAYLTKWN